jgi:hypothetical protein
MQDMTVSEVLKDPLIHQVLRADKVSLDVFAALISSAANALADGFPPRGRHASRSSASAARRASQPRVCQNALLRTWSGTGIGIKRHIVVSGRRRLRAVLWLIAGSQA